ncbi:Protein STRICTOSIDINE SYNTHASE-LIKE 11 [Linum perenne]
MALVTVILAVPIASFPSVVVAQTPFRQLHFPPGKPGGFSVAAAPGGVLFTSIMDGSILRYSSSAGWSTFAYVTTTRTNATCENTTEPVSGPVCGYPLGLAYDGLTGQLFIAEGYRGLLRVGPEAGMVAIRIATATNNTVPFNTTVGVDINPLTRNVYFTDSSTNYQINEWFQAIGANDATGRLLQYNMNTQQVTVLRNGLGFPTGVAISADGSFLLVSETSLNRTTRLWLTGPMANTTEPFITNSVRPVSIRRTVQGEFLIAANVVDLASQLAVPVAVRADSTGRIVETTPLSEQYGDLLVSEVNRPSMYETYISSPYAPYIGIYEGPV